MRPNCSCFSSSLLQISISGIFLALTSAVSCLISPCCTTYLRCVVVTISSPMLILPEVIFSCTRCFNFFTGWYIGKDIFPPGNLFFGRRWARFVRWHIHAADIPCSARYSFMTWPQLGAVSPYLLPSSDHWTGWSGAQDFASCRSWSLSMLRFCDLHRCLRFRLGVVVFSFFCVLLRPWVLHTRSNLSQLIQPCHYISTCMSLSTMFFISRRNLRFSKSLVLWLGFKIILDRGVSVRTFWTDFWNFVWHTAPLASNVDPKVCVIDTLIAERFFFLWDSELIGNAREADSWIVLH